MLSFKNYIARHDRMRLPVREDVGGLAIVASAYMPADLDIPARVKIINNFWDSLGGGDYGDLVIFALAPT